MDLGRACDGASGWDVDCLSFEADTADSGVLFSEVVLLEFSFKYLLLLLEISARNWESFSIDVFSAGNKRASSP